MRGIARKGDREYVHCSTPYRSGAFRTVFANGIPVSGHGHKNTPHKKPCGKFCCGHTAALRASTRSVFAEGRLVGRLYDRTCTAVARASRDVIVGD